MGSCGGGGGYRAWLDGGNWSRKADMYISSTPWKPLMPSRDRISGPSPHTTKYSKIRDDDPISAAGTRDHRPPGRYPRCNGWRLLLPMLSAHSAREREEGGRRSSGIGSQMVVADLQCRRKGTMSGGSDRCLFFYPLRIHRQFVRFPLFCVYFFTLFIFISKGCV